MPQRDWQALSLGSPHPSDLFCVSELRGRAPCEKTFHGTPTTPRPSGALSTTSASIPTPPQMKANVRANFLQFACARNLPTLPEKMESQTGGLGLGPSGERTICGEDPLGFCQVKGPSSTPLLM